MIPPVVPFLSSDILPFSWQMLASGSAFSKTAVRVTACRDWIYEMAG